MTQKYRIKSHDNYGYIVQQRIWLKWHTVTGVDKSDTTVWLEAPDRIFNTLEGAREHVQEMKEAKEISKKAKYIEYL